MSSSRMTYYSNVIVESWMSETVKKIHTSFNDHIRKSSERGVDMRQEIVDWGNTLIHRIQEHVRDQISRLEQEYGKQEQCLQDTRRQFLLAAQSHEQNRDNERIRQLFEQCNALKVELGTLEFPERTIPFVEYMTEEQVERKKRDERNARSIEDNKSRNQSSVGFSKDTVNNTGGYEHSPSTFTSTTSKQINQHLSTTSQFSTDNNSPMNINNNSNRIAENSVDLESKCPTCFMIFPKSMSPSDRNLHTNAHFNDSL